MDLESRGLGVISRMRTIPGISDLPVEQLPSIPLGLLRRNATRLHAVCRYRRGVRKKDGVSPSDVRCIDVHPYALTEEWSRYADFVLYHEFLHALLPVTGHGPGFRALESLWPDEEADAMGNGFRDFIRERRSDILKWELHCPSCGWSYMRKKPMTGRRCVKCKTTLENIEKLS